MPAQPATPQAVKPPGKPVEGFSWNYEHQGEKPASFADWFPGYCKAVERFPEDGDVEGLREFWDFDHEADKWGDYWTLTGEDEIWFIMSRDTVRQGGKPWRRKEFHRQFIKYLDEEIAREEAADELAKREAARDERASRAGRKPSHASNDALKIQYGLGMSWRHAYRIAKEGTDDRETQGRLAAIFEADPTRCYRAAWARKTGKWGRAPSDSFRAYIAAQVAAFEAGDAVGALDAAYRDTALPVAFDSLPAFLTALGKAENPIDPADAVTIWTGYEVWRLSR